MSMSKPHEQRQLFLRFLLFWGRFFLHILAFDSYPFFIVDHSLSISLIALACPGFNVSSMFIKCQANSY